MEYPVQDEWNAAIDGMADLIKRDFGERCPDFDPGCWCCRMWKAHDELAFGSESNWAPKWWPQKKER